MNTTTMKNATDRLDRDRQLALDLDLGRLASLLTQALDARLTPTEEAEIYWLAMRSTAAIEGVRVGTVAVRWSREDVERLRKVDAHHGHGAFRTRATDREPEPALAA